MGAAAGMAGSALLHAAPKVPRPAGELVVTLPSRSLVRLSDFKGKVVAVELLLTTCPHCQRCSSVLQKMMGEFSSQGFQAIGAAINDGALGDMARFIAISGAKFPVGVTPREMGYDFLQVTQTMRGPYFPQLVFVDRAGTIRAQYGGEEDFFLPEKEETNVRQTITSLLGGGKK
jgi:hypothetical protein